MTAEDQAPFGSLLKRYRGVAGLTQEELAEHAGLSARAVSDLERGVNARPRAYTVRQLVGALQLSPDDRRTFERAALAPVAAPTSEDTSVPGNLLGRLPPMPPTDLIAREEERDRIRTVLATVLEGTGQVVLFGGESGIGKTRLLQQVMVEAQERGFLILAVRCASPEGNTQSHPFLEALHDLMARSPARLSLEVQRRSKKIRTLMDASASGTGAASDAVAQQELTLALGDLVLLVAADVPLAVLLDDLQWADRHTLKVLQHLARSIHSSRVLIAGAFRDLHLTDEYPDLADTLKLLDRQRLGERITVRRLSLEETMALAAATMGQERISEEFASFVYRRTKGNPRLIDQLVRSLGGRLELQGEIGAGSMGRVFRAHDRTLQQTVAAKLMVSREEIDLDALLRFQQEGAVLSRLSHPHIVDIYDTFAEEHASCIIMELLEGRSLGQILHDGPVSLARAKTLILQVADALSYAHSQEIVHRDIKPDNVMVLERDQVKVTDFGIARILRPDTSLETIATTGMRMGTPLYMAPEQIEGKRIDGRTDIYALGAMLYHMVTGRPPFEGNDALAVAVKHLQAEPVPPSQIDPAIPAEWDGLILKAMAKEPKDRFQSVPEMQRALGAPPVEPAGHGSARWRDRYAAPAIVGSAMAAVAAVVIALTVGLPGRVAGHPFSLTLAPYTSASKAIVAKFTAPEAFGAIVPSNNGALWVGTDYGDVLHIDPATNKVAADIPINDPTTASRHVKEPGIVQVVSGSGQLWALDRVHKEVVRIDPATNGVMKRVRISIEPFSSAIAGDTLWVGSSYEDDRGVDTIVRIDLRTGTVVDTITNSTAHLGEPFLTLAASPHALWYVDWSHGTVKRLDAATNKVTATTTLPDDPAPSFQVVDGSSVWVTSHFSNMVTRIDARTNDVIASIPLIGYPSSAHIDGDCCGQTLAVGAGAVWTIAGSGGRTLVRIDPRTNHVTASLTLSQPTQRIAFANGTVWVQSDNTLYRLDPSAIKGT